MMHFFSTCHCTSRQTTNSSMYTTYIVNCKPPRVKDFLFCDFASQGVREEAIKCQHKPVNHLIIHSL